MTLIESDLLPKAFDLSPLLSALSRRVDKQSVAARAALKHCRDAQSAVHDLLFALELLENLRTDSAKAENGELPLPAAMQGALFSQAILLYVRATEISKERKCLNIRHKLSVEQLIVHEKMVKLRHKVIAHLDNDRSFGRNSFAEERLILIHQLDGMQSIRNADMRIVRQFSTEVELNNLVRAVLAITNPILVELHEDIRRHLYALSENDPGVSKLIESKPFDAVAFYADEKAGRAFLGGGGLGIDPEKQATFVDDWLDPKRG